MTYAHALETLAENSESRGEYAIATTWWKRLCRHDPFRSVAVLGLMRALEAEGDPAGALRLAENHARLLRDELGIRPPADLATTVARLQGIENTVLPSIGRHQLIAPDPAGSTPAGKGAWRLPRQRVAEMLESDTLIVRRPRG